MTMKETKFEAKILMIGCGSIGQGVIPLLFKHLDIKPEQLTIITADSTGAEIARQFNVKYIENAFTPENFIQLLEESTSPGDLVLNLSVNVSSLELVRFCQSNNRLYLDTCTEPWSGWYTDNSLSLQERSNYYLRKEMLALREQFNQSSSPTALITHGANPGIISHFVKIALINLANDIGIKYIKPESREEWAKLAQQLDIKIIQVAERDTQKSSIKKERNEFCNTWSVEGLYSEACQPSELGWGTHEKILPQDGFKFSENSPSIYINKPGYETKVHTYTPSLGRTIGSLITHAEAISIADYFTLTDKTGTALYRPTVYYAYRPSDDTVESLEEVSVNNGIIHENKRILLDDIFSGYDELGVLLMGHKKNSYWFGSKMEIEKSRELITHNNATSLQVTAGVLAGIIWIINNINQGIVEPEDINYLEIFTIAKPYLGEIIGHYSNWNTEESTDDWQFSSFRV